jgi:hypothetical protein
MGDRYPFYNRVLPRTWPAAFITVSTHIQPGETFIANLEHGGRPRLSEGVERKSIEGFAGSNAWPRAGGDLEGGSLLGAPPTREPPIIVSGLGLYINALPVVGSRRVRLRSSDV